MKRISPLLLLLLLLSGCGSPTPLEELPVSLPPDCQQYIEVRGKANSHKARLMLYEKDVSQGIWFRLDEIPATVGKNGIAQPGEKKEGDGKTPHGLYELERAFGYAETLDTKLAYLPAKEDDIWIDDATAPDYNQWAKSPTNAKSFELMKRSDDLYEIGAVIEYNTKPVIPGKGSAIFLHVWGGPDSPTAGCVAVEKSTLANILKWLDRTKRPHIVILFGDNEIKP